MVQGAVGALAQVQAVSNLSLWLDVSPECTIWQQEYCRCSPFALVEGTNCASSSIRFGACLQWEIPRAGDLLTSTFFKMRVQGARFGSNHTSQGEDRKLSWVNSMGHAAIREAFLEIGQITVDKVSGEMMEILEQHKSPLGNEQGESIGSFDNASDLRDWTYNEQLLHVHLPFFFADHPEVALPIIALSAHVTRIRIFLREKLALLNAEDAVTPVPNPIDLSQPNNLDSVFDGRLMDAVLVTRMAFLDQFERNLVSAEVHELVIVQNQEDCSEVILAGTTQKSTVLSFNNAIIALFSRWRADSSTATQNFNTKDYFNYLVDFGLNDQPDANSPAAGAPRVAPYDVTTVSNGSGHATGVLGKTPIDTYQLKFNSADRLEPTDAEYLTQVIPYLHAVKKSKSRGILMYSFGMDPMAGYHHPCGHAMFSRIHEVKACVAFCQDSEGNNLVTEDGTWAHFARSYNVLRMAMGQAILKFA